MTNERNNDLNYKHTKKTDQVRVELAHEAFRTIIFL